jgi:hypothetical protein
MILPGMDQKARWLKTSAKQAKTSVVRSNAAARLDSAGRVR